MDGWSPCHAFEQHGLAGPRPRARSRVKFWMLRAAPDLEHVGVLGDPARRSRSRALPSRNGETGLLARFCQVVETLYP